MTIAAFASLSSCTFLNNSFEKSKMILTKPFIVNIRH